MALGSHFWLLLSSFLLIVSAFDPTISSYQPGNYWLESGFVEGPPYGSVSIRWKTNEAGTSIAQPDTITLQGSASCNGHTKCWGNGGTSLSRWHVAVSVSPLHNPANGANQQYWPQGSPAGVTLVNVGTGETLDIHKVVHFAWNGNGMFFHPWESNDLVTEDFGNIFNTLFPVGSTIKVVTHCENGQNGNGACGPLDQEKMNPRATGFETGFYTASLNWETLALSLDANSPVGRGGSRVSSGTTSLTVQTRLTADGTTHTCAAPPDTGDSSVVTDETGYPIRVVTAGRFFSHWQGVALDCGSGGTAKLDVIAWPDCIEVTLRTDNPGAVGEVNGGDATAVVCVDSSGVLSYLPSNDGSNQANVLGSVVLAKNLDNGLPLSPPTVFGYTDMGLALSFDVPTSNPNSRYTDQSYRFSFTNPSTSESLPLRLVFERNGVSGITGFVPVIQNINHGKPLGVHVQISKNWHNRENMTGDYRGTWFSVGTVLVLGPSKTVDFDLVFHFSYFKPAIGNAWHSIHTVSHAQLSLIGWGTNGLWEEVGFASNGEAITYEPHGQQVRCSVDDVRPVLVCAKDDDVNCQGSVDNTQWTFNTGGADFLVLISSAPDYSYQFPVHMRSHHHETGPWLTNAEYTADTADGALSSKRRVSTVTSDDFIRHMHELEVTVNSDVNYERVTLYQIGTDNYNLEGVNWLVYGNAAGPSGIIDLNAQPAGDFNYLSESVPLTGNAPYWFTLVADNLRANRGLIIHDFDARVGGVDNIAPSFSLQKVRWGRISLEISLPSVSVSFLAGDYANVRLEYIIPPRSASDYFGLSGQLDINFGQYLSAATDPANTSPYDVNGVVGTAWRLVHQEALCSASAGRVTVSQGTLVEDYPVRVAVDASNAASFDVSFGSSECSGLETFAILAPFSADQLTVQVNALDYTSSMHLQSSIQEDGSFVHTFAIDRQTFGSSGQDVTVTVGQDTTVVYCYSHSCSAGTSLIDLPSGVLCPGGACSDNVCCTEMCDAHTCVQPDWVDKVNKDDIMCGTGSGNCNNEICCDYTPAYCSSVTCPQGWEPLEFKDEIVCGDGTVACTHNDCCYDPYMDYKDQPVQLMISGQCADEPNNANPARNRVRCPLQSGFTTDTSSIYHDFRFRTPRGFFNATGMNHWAYSNGWSYIWMGSPWAATAADINALTLGNGEIVAQYASEPTRCNTFTCPVGYTDKADKDLLPCALSAGSCNYEICCDVAVKEKCGNAGHTCSAGLQPFSDQAGTVCESGGYGCVGASCCQDSDCCYDPALDYPHPNDVNLVISGDCFDEPNSNTPAYNRIRCPLESTIAENSWYRQALRFRTPRGTFDATGVNHWAYNGATTYIWVGSPPTATAAEINNLVNSGEEIFAQYP